MARQMWLLPLQGSRLVRNSDMFMTSLMKLLHCWHMIIHDSMPICKFLYCEDSDWQKHLITFYRTLSWPGANIWMLRMGPRFGIGQFLLHLVDFEAQIRATGNGWNAGRISRHFVEPFVVDVNGIVKDVWRSQELEWAVNVVKTWRHAFFGLDSILYPLGGFPVWSWNRFWLQGAIDAFRKDWKVCMFETSPEPHWAKKSLNKCWWIITWTVRGLSFLYTIHWHTLAIHSVCFSAIASVLFTSGRAIFAEDRRRQAPIEEFPCIDSKWVTSCVFELMLPGSLGAFGVEVAQRRCI